MGWKMRFPGQAAGSGVQAALQNKSRQQRLKTKPACLDKTAAFVNTC